MKKQILLAAVAISGMVLGTVNAQIQYNKKDAAVGFIGQDTLENGNYRFIMDFNTTVAYGAKVSSSNGKGVYGMGITTEGLNSNKAEWIGNDYKTENTGSSLKFVRFKDVNHILDSLTVDEEPAYSINNTYWKAGNVLLDVPGTDGADQAFTVWGGTSKRRILGIQVKAQDLMAGMLSDIQFDLLTLDPGNVVKIENNVEVQIAATYKMIVDFSKQAAFPYFNSTFNNVGDDIALLDSISEANIDAVNAVLGSKMYVVDNVYVSSLEENNINRVTVKVAESLGLSVADLRGKKVAITLYATTSGTQVQPGMFEPVVGIDNITGEYAEASWIDPAVKNNERDALAINAIKGEENAIKYKLKGRNRMSDLTIVADGDNKLSTAFYFKAEGSVMSINPETGAYDVPVEYTYSPTTDETGLSVTIKSNTDGSAIDDDLEITLYTNFPTGNRSYSLEINNGARFWLDILATGIEGTDISDQTAAQIRITTAEDAIYVENAVEDVTVTNTSGQVVATATAATAAKGISLAQGVYVVKTGELVQKALVK